MAVAKAFSLCGTLDECGPFVEASQIDEECRGLLDAARRLNEVNRQVRNLIAANVAAMLKICGQGEDLAANTQAVLDLLATDQAMTTLQQFREASHGN